jgi:hypothetical protein
MAPLTWRNVATPAMGNPIDAMRLSGELFDRGFTGLNEGISRFSAWKDDQNTRLVNDAALRIQDPVAFRQALENNTLLANMPPGSVPTAALTGLQTRAGTLIEQATGQQSLDTARARDPFLIRQAGTTAARGEFELANAREDRPLQRAALERGDQRDAAYTPTYVDAQQAALRDATDTRTAQDYFTRIRPSLVVPADASEALAEARGNLSPGAFRRLTEMLQTLGNFPGLYAPGSVAPDGAVIAPVGSAAVTPTTSPTAPGAARAGGGAAGATPTAPEPTANNARGTIATAAGADNSGNTNEGLRPSPTGRYADSIPIPETRTYVDRTYNRFLEANNGSLPAVGSHRDMADRLLPFVVQSESAGRHRNADGSLVTSTAGAEGVTQVMPATSRDPGFGVRPRQNDSREEFMRVGRDYLEAMLRRYDGNVELALAAYNAGPGRVDDWRRTGRVTQTAQQSGGIVRRAEELERDITSRRSQNNATGITPDVRAAEGRNVDAGTVARELRAGSYSTMPEAALINEINRLVQRGVSPSVAGAMIARNPQGVSRGIENSAAGWRDHESVRPNTTAIDEEVTRYLARDTRTAEGVDQNLARAQTALANARSRAENLRNEALRLARAAQSNPDLRRRAEEYHENYRRAVRRVEELVIQFDEEQYKPTRVAPVAPPPPSAATPGSTGMTPSYPRPTDEERSRIRRAFGG